MGQRLDELARTRREGKEKTRGQEDEKEDGDEDVRIEGCHFFFREKVYVEGMNSQLKY